MNNEKLIESMAKRATPADRALWRRQMGLLQDEIAKLEPIENQILDLIAQKQPIMDTIADIREKMVAKCIHPAEHLHVVDDTVDTHIIARCTFCNTTMTIRKDVK